MLQTIMSTLQLLSLYGCGTIHTTMKRKLDGVDLVLVGIDSLYATMIYIAEFPYMVI